MIRPCVQIFLLLSLAVSMLGCSGCRTSVEPREPLTTLIPPPRQSTENQVLDDADEADIGRPKTPEGQAEPVRVPLTLMKTIYFDFDRSGIRPDQKEAMERNAAYLLENPGKVILVEGHCDERGTLEYNMALGHRRANEVARFIMSRGVDADRLDTRSKGEEAPAVVGTGEAVWRKNRRVEFYFKN